MRVGFQIQFSLWYMLSKTLAEEAAWKFAKENGIDMVTINPGWVIGPLLQPTLNLSVEEVLKLLKGDTFPNKTHRWVDVRDVAMAHIQAYELPTARGRYCLVGSILHCSETMKILRKLYPALNLPEKCADDKPYEPTYMVSQEKTKSLGIDFTPLEMSGEGKVVSVTGASGFIASWLVKLLLQHRYTVKATVQDPNDPKKTQHLLSLDGAQERLHLFKADLLEEGSFDSVVDGCDGVFHTASPVALEAINPQAELIDPALKGTINVLRSCSKVPSVKRVVVTSSLASVLFTGEPLTPEVLIDESWFSDPVLCKESKQWYVLSKTLAEEAAWNFSKENGIDMVTLNPGWVIGPLLQPTLNLSAEQVLNLINGAQTFPNISSWWVDVRDVANAHIQAYEIPEASGRYCLVERDLHNSEILKILRKLYPGLPLPEKCADDKPYAPSSRVSQEKAKSLGIHFTPLEVSLKDTVESLKEKNFVSF
ncbi:cinnamoyl-CoA reductase 1-like [Vitis riparia]|uniref:cinnamoyl-CoA reductase 1-like n=1 Tax=Vitis riparia TaxID=96939 RepID=UPI00155B32E5|nr:cinnamoyl-CoA reductase 1-like [Vitis riparia]